MKTQLTQIDSYMFSFELVGECRQLTAVLCSCNSVEIHTPQRGSASQNFFNQRRRICAPEKIWIQMESQEYLRCGTITDRNPQNVLLLKTFTLFHL